jgi:hypothetical protein
MDAVGWKSWTGSVVVSQGKSAAWENAPLICGADGASLECQSQSFLLLDLPPKAWAIH